MFSQALDEWAYRNGVRLHFIDPGEPVQNAFIESFNGKFRDECLNEKPLTVFHATTVSGVWPRSIKTPAPQQLSFTITVDGGKPAMTGTSPAVAQNCLFWFASPNLGCV
jgi:hypothetical protein